ncbi:probable receptor-like protein kinase At1g49730 [Andrographis paniculata]|uniref:probable receptor-like protein kinase At1g49730 n=1 Tax=Andrographis paniculata TaxID=175694 RepID=UPI0021E720D1|nr:probable receptor-like protein kinase At1g49730 [Andrographis paniculata]
MGDDNLMLKIRMLLLAWFHFRLYHEKGLPLIVKRFSYKDIKKATDGFKRIINNSSQGTSYKAKFQNGSVATVKEVKLPDEDDDSFIREVQLLGRLHHRHILAVCGYSTGSKRFLVFENMENGSLKEHLSDPLRTPLNWRTRLQIAIGIAAAVEYLHFFCDPPIHQVSLSSSSILLDENLIPKISDISLFNASGNQITSLPTSSHCSKECAVEGCKNIIFQLGLVILELITGQSAEKGGVDLVQWVQESRFPGSIHKMIDPDLGNSYDQRELKGLLSVARLCIRCVDRQSICTPQILWYLQKKIGITRRSRPS